MAGGIAADLKKPFAQQIAAFRLRMENLVGTTAWDDLTRAQHDRAFMVAGAMKADLLADLAASVDRAVSEGGTLESFRKDFRGIVERHGWHGWTGEESARGQAWRTRVIYKTNMATSYAAGRLAQLREGKFAFWVYRHGGSLEPRLDHLSWNAVALEPDHPFWATHYPPNGWGCSCYVVGARTAAGVRRLGGNPDKVLPEGWQAISPKTGAPVGIDKNWDYAPGASVAEDITALAAQKITRLPPELGAAFGRSLKDPIEEAWAAWLGGLVKQENRRPGLAGVLDDKTIAALRARGSAPRSAEVMVDPGLIVGPKAKRHEMKGDAISPQDWARLPELLRNPTSAMIDTKSGGLLLLLGEGEVQLVVRLDFALKVQRVSKYSNLVVSAYRPKRVHLLERLSSGLLELIWGAMG